MAVGDKEGNVVAFRRKGGGGPPVAWPEIRDNGNPVARSRPNIRAYLDHVKALVRYDEFRMECIIAREGEGPCTMSDALATDLWLDADDLGLKYAERYFVACVESIARENTSHPVREYIDGLVWDGVARLDEWLHAYLGAENSPLNSAYGRKHMIAGVRRIRHPGVKYDNILVFDGAQGIGKSSAIAALCPEPAYFTDCILIGDDHKEIIEKTGGKWLCEVAEMDGMSKRDVGTAKAMISRQADRSRLAYGRLTVERPRQFILWGSVNENTYLRDLTGNRRFWPVRISDTIKRNEVVDMITRDRDQFWAEAAYYEAAGEQLDIPEELYAASALAQKARTIGDPWQDVLAPELEGKVGLVAKEMLWARLGMKIENLTQAHSQRLNSIMKNLGFGDSEGNRRRDRKPTKCFIHDELRGGKAGDWLNV